MKQKNMILMAVAVGCGLVAAFLTTQINAKPKIETVEVLVATKDLPTGTLITKDNMMKVTARKKIPKDALPQQFVTSEDELLEKRLARAVRADEVFNPADMKKGSTIIFPEGKDIISMSIGASNAAAGAVGPGSKVDIMASLQMGAVLEVFPLLIDMHVLEVNGEPDLTKNVRFPNMSTVSFAVNQEEALLIMLAKKRGCHLELLLRNPNKPLDKDYDIKKVKEMLQTEKSPTKTLVSDGSTGQTGMGTTETPIAPVPSLPAKPETVKVLIASEDVSPNTEITKDLVGTKLVVKEMLKEYAEGAVADLAPHYGKALKNGLAKGQWVTESMVGNPALKPAPQDDKIDSLPKPGPDDKPEVKKPVAPAVAGVETHDVAVHTASGTVIHRFQRPVGGAWKLTKVLSTDEASRSAPPATAAPTPTPAGPEKKPEAPDAAKKID